MYDKHFVGLDLTGFQDNGLQRPISRVTLLVDDGNAVTAGDDSGTELSADCPHATQAMADRILAQVKGYRYQMFSADNANLDPAAELGDGVTAGGVYSVISRISSDGSGYAGIAAPGEEELEDEYPAAGPMMQAFQRKIAQTRSQILKTAEEITLKVENEVQQLSASFTVQLDGISAQVTDLGGSVKLTLDTLNGLTVTDASGSTQIKGSCIDTTTLRANSISADKLSLTGSISFSDLTSSAQDTINSAASAASAASNTVQGWCYPGTTEINGQMIRTGTVEASVLRGGQVELLSSRGVSAGTIEIERTSFQTPGSVVFSSQELSVLSTEVSLYLQGGDVSLNVGVLDVRIDGAQSLRPQRDDSCLLGRSGAAWSDLYVVNDPIVTSDRSRKTDISYGLAAYEALFDALRPASYRFAGGQSGRTHLGLIAQDVEQALVDCGLSGMDFAGFIKSPRLDGTGQVLEGEYDYALRYGELIPLCIYKIQTLSARVAELERRTVS